MKNTSASQNVNSKIAKLLARLAKASHSSKTVTFDGAGICNYGMVTCSNYSAHSDDEKLQNIVEKHIYDVSLGDIDCVDSYVTRETMAKCISTSCRTIDDTITVAIRTGICASYSRVMVMSKNAIAYDRIHQCHCFTETVGGFDRMCGETRFTCFTYNIDNLSWLHSLTIDCMQINRRNGDMHIILGGVYAGYRITILPYGPEGSEVHYNLMAKIMAAVDMSRDIVLPSAMSWEIQRYPERKFAVTMSSADDDTITDITAA
jgi:hypothetical protein